MDLTREELLKLFDYSDGDLLWKVMLCPSVPIGKKAGVVDSRGYRITTIRGKRYYNHRLVFLMHHGYLPEEVDHKDNNQGNNRIENLRAASRRQNGSNRGVQKNNASGAKGVSKYKDTNLWRVRLKVNRKEMHFGYYEDFDLAELVAIEARNKHHGEFARHK